MKSQERRTKATLKASPWIIVGSALILMIIVVVLAVQNNHREKDYMSRILKEKGAALIKGVEAGARTGMMGMMWGGQQVQTLLEETANLPDVLYMTITNQDGAFAEPVDRPLRRHVAEVIAGGDDDRIVGRRRREPSVEAPPRRRF